MRRGWLVALLAFGTLTACASMPEGDRLACGEFRLSADVLQERTDKMLSGTPSEADRTAYREFLVQHPLTLLAASEMAETPELRADLASAAALFAGGTYDQTTAYFLTEVELRKTCD